MAVGLCSGEGEGKMEGAEPSSSVGLVPPAGGVTAGGGDVVGVPGQVADVGLLVAEKLVAEKVAVGEGEERSSPLE